MKKQLQKLTAVLLTALILSAVLFAAPVTASAAEVTTDAVGARTGKCKWNLDSDGTLTISGQGAMADYDNYYSLAPWGTEIKKVIIEDGVTNIGEFAFADCIRLSSVSIPNSVTTIGYSAFYNTNLSSIVIPDSVTCIDYDAFRDCTGLKSISLGSGITDFERYCFSGCNNITKITVSPDNPTYDSRNACNAVIETATNTLLLPCKKTVIPDSVARIDDYAYADYPWVKNITIPDSVTGIGEYAFSECKNLTTITLGNGLTDIAYGAFEDCEKLTTVTLGNSLTHIGNRAFDCCTDLNSIHIPDSVTTIGDQAFWRCENLASVSFGSDLTSIGDDAFYGCSALNNITIPDNVTSVGGWAFGNCSKVESITIGSGLTDIGDQAFFLNQGNLKSLTVSQQNPAYDSRNDCNAIIETATNTLILGCQTTVIPDSITSIGDYALVYCSELTELTIPEGVTTIGDYAFAGCSGLTELTIPAGVTSIGEIAFCFCDQLISLTVSQQNQTYDSREDCDAIIETATNTLISGCQTTIIPNSVTSIGDGAFYYCSELTDIKIPNSVTSIGKYAFYACNSLRRITIPASVTSIGIMDDYDDFYISAFDGCSGDFKICGYAGTYAEAYAEEFDIRFFDLNNAGDVDGTPGVSINDVTVIQKHVAELTTLEGDALMAADTNGDGVVDINDATYLQMYLAEYDVVLG